jgi:hypothetical protein
MWQAVGVSSWGQLKKKIPQSHTLAYYHTCRSIWPDQCRSAQAILSDKAALLALADPSWRSPYLNFKKHCIPDTVPIWWYKALEGDGLVLKPIGGSRSRGVVHFYIDDEYLQCDGLFNSIYSRIYLGSGGNTPILYPCALFEYWQQLNHSKEEALAMPFIRHSYLLPFSRPSAVMRVITRKDTLESDPYVQIAWLRVPLNSNQKSDLQFDACINLHGYTLPFIIQDLSNDQLLQLSIWEKALAQNCFFAVYECLNLSIAMHSLLPPIDQVAWEWIPTDPKPLLIEGNNCFGILVRQLFQEIEETMPTTCRIFPYRHLNGT